eukprot:gene25967-32478_t
MSGHLRWGACAAGQPTRCRFVRKSAYGLLSTIEI